MNALIHKNEDLVAVAISAGIGPGCVVVTWNMDSGVTRDVTVTQAIPVGHKIALQDLQAGSPVLKYGVSIGTASIDIRAGEHVHIHNLKSNRW